MKQIESLTWNELFVELFEQLSEIKDEIRKIKVPGRSSPQLPVQKSVLSFKETAIYLDVSHSYLYKLTSQNRIPHFKPQGKKIYFDLSMLEDWLKRNYQTTQDEIEQKANEYISRNPILKPDWYITPQVVGQKDL